MQPRRLQIIAAVSAAVVALTSARAYACLYHELQNLPEPVASWPDRLSITSSFASTASAPSEAPLGPPFITDPSILSWKTATGAKAHSPDATINSYVSSITADVDTVAYDTSYAYIHSSDLPSHNVGPFPGN